LPASLYSQDWLLRLHGRDTGIPYGIALAFAGLLIYPETDWIRAVDLTRFGFH
jgi:prepilin peptidase CpaA